MDGRSPTKESDEAVKGLQYGYVTLEKNGERLFGNVRNDSEEAVTVENCFITALYGDMDTTRVPIAVHRRYYARYAGGNISCRVSEDYEKTEDTENGTEIYTFYADETKEKLHGDHRGSGSSPGKGHQGCKAVAG